MSEKINPEVFYAFNHTIRSFRKKGKKLPDTFIKRAKHLEKEFNNQPNVVKKQKIFWGDNHE